MGNEYISSVKNANLTYITWYYHSCFSWLSKYEKSRNLYKSVSIRFSAFYKKSAPVIHIFSTLWCALEFMKVNTWWDMRMSWKFWITKKNNYDNITDFMAFCYKISIYYDWNRVAETIQERIKK